MIFFKKREKKDKVEVKKSSSQESEFSTIDRTTILTTILKQIYQYRDELMSSINEVVEYVRSIDRRIHDLSISSQEMKEFVNEKFEELRSYLQSSQQTYLFTQVGYIPTTCEELKNFIQFSALRIRYNDLDISCGSFENIEDVEVGRDYKYIIVKYNNGIYVKIKFDNIELTGLTNRELSIYDIQLIKDLVKEFIKLQIK